VTDTKTLGTLLRHLVELLDGAVEEAYVEAGLDYRPRYTPVMRALLALGPTSIRAISLHAGTTHSAASQTVAQMAREGLVELRPGTDARERIVALTPRARGMLPALKRQWARINVAAKRLDRELSTPLSPLLAEAIAALAREPFARRIRRTAASSRTRRSR
jgi:DNA-binding MarR family transcriptional regulator